MPTGSLLAQFHSRHDSVTDNEQPNEHHDSLSPPGSPLAGNRRPRSESVETDSEDRREEKRRKQFATSLCIATGLPETALDEFISLNHTDMLIKIQANILQMQLQETKSLATKFIASEEFKVILKDRLRACLLSPNLTAYVSGLGDQIFAFAKKNVQIFKIPEAALNDPEMNRDIIFLIKEILTSQRSNMKQKLANHITSKSHISILCKSLAPGGGYEITAAHWARVAFLRDSLSGFSAVVEKSQDHDRYPSSDTDENDEDKLKEKVWSHADFWEYVDIVLRELRAEARSKEDTPAARAKYLEMFFTRCLQRDRNAYPGSITSPALPAFEKVTVPWQTTIYNGLIW